MKVKKSVYQIPQVKQTRLSKIIGCKSEQIQNISKLTNSTK